MKKFHTCRECKHSKITHIMGTPCCSIECKLFYTVNPIDGFKRYKNCIDLNIDGDCENYEESFIRRVNNYISKILSE